MSKKTTTPATDNPTVPREALNEADCYVQKANDQLSAVAKAIKALLKEPDTGAMRVAISALCESIECHAEDAMNCVNVLAKSYGANYTGDDGAHRALYDAAREGEALAAGTPSTAPTSAPAALATSPSTEAPRDQLAIPPAVHDLAQEITWQIEGTLTTLFAASTNRSNGDVLPWTVRSIAARLNDLNNMLMAALDVESNGGADEVEGRMRAVVYGEFNAMAQGVSA